MRRAEDVQLVWTPPGWSALEVLELFITQVQESLRAWKVPIWIVLTRVRVLPDQSVFLWGEGGGATTVSFTETWKSLSVCSTLSFIYQIETSMTSGTPHKKSPPSGGVQYHSYIFLLQLLQLKIWDKPRKVPGTFKWRQTQNLCILSLTSFIYWCVN